MKSHSPEYYNPAILISDVCRADPCTLLLAASQQSARERFCLHAHPPGAARLLAGQGHAVYLYYFDHQPNGSVNCAATSHAAPDGTHFRPRPPAATFCAAPNLIHREPHCVVVNCRLESVPRMVVLLRSRKPSHFKRLHFKVPRVFPRRGGARPAARLSHLCIRRIFSMCCCGHWKHISTYAGIFASGAGSCSSVCALDRIRSLLTAAAWPAPDRTHTMDGFQSPCQRAGSATRVALRSGALRLRVSASSRGTPRLPRACPVPSQRARGSTDINRTVVSTFAAEDGLVLAIEASGGVGGRRAAPTAAASNPISDGVALLGVAPCPNDVLSDSADPRLLQGHVRAERDRTGAFQPCAAGGRGAVYARQGTRGGRGLVYDFPEYMYRIYACGLYT